jgi:flagellar M-ring protein FliF
MANEPLHPQNLTASVRALSYFPLLRQVGVMIGLAASVALGVAAVMWVQTPGFRPLYANLAEKDQARVIEELAKAGIPHKIDNASGAILVPDKQTHEARLKLAAQGLPKAGHSGFEAMESASSFGSSQFLETARYQHALEGELARSVMGISVVQSARVHLAIPKQSAFVRNRQQPSASVVVSLYAGRALDEGQVAAIVHLVASSVPNLTAENVTIVDQQGRLLASNGRQQRELGLTATQFEQTRKLEESYVKRVEDILSPIIGTGGVRAQAALDMDFTLTEQTQESFNPETKAVRSEQVAEEVAQQAPGAVAGAGGVPGALSNQPPAAGTVTETAAARPAEKADAAKDAKGGKDGKGKAAGGEAVAAAPANASRRAVRNYELDRTIQHTRVAPGRIKRLSVAVLVDNKQTVNADGEAERKPLAKEEIERLTALVKDAVGFNAERGDSVQVTNIAFSTPPEAEPPPEPGFLEKPWLADLGKQSLAAFLVLSIVFGVLRPLLRSLASKPLPAEIAAPAGAYPALPHAGGARHALPGGPADYETQLNTAKSLATQDPKRVAQVVKNWVANDG